MRSLVLVTVGLAIGFAPLGAVDVFPQGVGRINAETIRIERVEDLAVAAPLTTEIEPPAGTRD